MCACYWEASVRTIDKYRLHNNAAVYLCLYTRFICLETCDNITEATRFMIHHMDTQKSVYVLFCNHMDCFHIQTTIRCFYRRLPVFDYRNQINYLHFIGNLASYWTLVMVWNVLFDSNYLPIFQPIVHCAFIYKHPAELRIKGVKCKQQSYKLKFEFLAFSPIIW